MFSYSKSQGIPNSGFSGASVSQSPPIGSQTPARAYDCSDRSPVINSTKTHLHSANIALRNIAPPCIGPKPTIQVSLQWNWSKFYIDSTCRNYLPEHASIFDFLRGELITFMWDHLQLFFSTYEHFWPIQKAILEACGAAIWSKKASLGAYRPLAC